MIKRRIDRPSQAKRLTAILRASLVLAVITALAATRGRADETQKPIAGPPSAELLDETNTLLYAGNSDAVDAALVKMLKRLDQAFPTDPDKTPDRDLQRMLAHDKIRTRLLDFADSDFRFPRGNRDRRTTCLQRARIYQALGRAEDLERFTQVIDHIVFGAFGETSKEFELGVNPPSVAHAMLQTAWTLVERGADPKKADGALGAMLFLRALHERPDYRPERWQNRLAWDLQNYEFSYVAVTYLLDRYPVPIPQPLPDNRHDENPVETISRYVYRGGDSTGPRPRLQIAAIHLAARTKSIYFQPALRKALNETQNDAVREAAEQALAACTRPKKEVDPELARASQFDGARADQLLSKVENSQAVAADYAELRELVGLDYGADRDVWLRWWEQDKYGRQMSGADQRPYIIRGRVIDTQGRPLAGATVSASPAREFSKFVYGGPVSGWVDTDRQGQFQLRFGPYNEAQVQFGVFPTVFRAGKKGFTIKSFSTTPRRYLCAEDIAGDSILQIDEPELLRPGVPLEIDFVMQPGVVLSAAVEDEQGDPVKAARVVLLWNDAGPPEPGPVCYCKCVDEYVACYYLLPWNDPPGAERGVHFEEQQDGSLHLPAMWEGVPRRLAVYRKLGDGAKAVVSENVTFDHPGHYHVRLILAQGADTVRVVVDEHADK